MANAAPGLMEDPSIRLDAARVAAIKTSPARHSGHMVIPLSGHALDAWRTRDRCPNKRRLNAAGTDILSLRLERRANGLSQAKGTAVVTALLLGAVLFARAAVANDTAAKINTLQREYDVLRTDVQRTDDAIGSLDITWTMQHPKIADEKALQEQLDAAAVAALIKGQGGRPLAFPGVHEVWFTSMTAWYRSRMPYPKGAW
ncbi:MAG: hypothetical protein GIX03_05890 [Candidatus Eremiobacteraeota bacterium]|nr:hypothetical protein [Candidatus Eremiobacteraeota bacterium]MBC5802527.1 hypothetical protein [Candidatus Eremiobacteraeota bacterium]MBC5820404.1 hypothetical protein [Candidatus Eremiobacteraeota bacterium]